MTIWQRAKGGAIFGLVLGIIGHFFIWYGAHRAGLEFRVNLTFLIGMALIGAVGGCLFWLLRRLAGRS